MYVDFSGVFKHGLRHFCSECHELVPIAAANNAVHRLSTSTEQRTIWNKLTINHEIQLPQTLIKSSRTTMQ